MTSFNTTHVFCPAPFMQELHLNNSPWSLLMSREMKPQQSLISTFVTDFPLIANIWWGLLIPAFLLSRQLKYTQVQISREKGDDETSLLVVTACFIIGIIATPLALMTLPIFIIYRTMVYFYLKTTNGPKFAGLLQGPDVVWAMELPEARSIITAMVTLTVDNKEDYGGERLLKTIRKVARKSFLGESPPFPKLVLLRRKSSLGYYYWTPCENVNVDTFVRPLDITTQFPGCVEESELKAIIGRECNKPLPFDDTATWEILVGNQPISNSSEKSQLFPVIFRIHHSVGDGVALLRVLLEGLADHSLSSASTKQKSWRMSHRDFIERTKDTIEDQGIVSPALQDNKFKLETSTSLPTCENKSESLKTRLKDLKCSLFKTKKVPSSSISPLILNTCNSLNVDLPSKTFPRVANPTVSFLKKEGVLYSSNRYSRETKEDCSTDSVIENNCPVFEKCTKLNQTTDLSTSVNENDIPPISLMEQLHLKIPHIKDLLLDVIVIAIACSVSIKRAAESLAARALPFFKNISKFAFFTPYLLYCQMFGPSYDQFLYGKQLTGQKVVSWISDDDISETLLSKIRRIREMKGPKVTFSHVLLTCLSRSLHRFYLRHHHDTPTFVNVVLPARVNMHDLTIGLKTTADCQVGAIKARVTRLYGSRRAMKPLFSLRNVSFSTSNDSDMEETLLRSQQQLKVVAPTNTTVSLKLDNKFTVAMFKLPVGTVPIQQGDRLLNKVAEECSRLKNGPDYIVNYWLLRWVAHLVPIPLLSFCLGGAPCSLVLSNLPGPDDIIHVANKRIKDIVFWVPNRGLNGMGIGMLSYCGRISMGISADRALISDTDSAHEIIAGIFDEVNLMHHAAS